MKKINTKHQDYIYLSKKRTKPKENFKFLNSILNKRLKDNFTFLDLGCAQGDFVFFLKENIKKKGKFVGIDYSQNLISQAKKLNTSKNIQFKTHNAEKYLHKEKANIINISGLISYFDNPKNIIFNSSKNLKKGGHLIIFDNFNFYDIDIIIRYRHNSLSKKFEKGWNIHSIDTIVNLAKLYKMKLQSIKNFKMPFLLKENKKDPARSWNIKVGNDMYFRNGLCQIYKLNALIFKKI